MFPFFIIFKYCSLQSLFKVCYQVPGISSEYFIASLSAKHNFHML